MDDTYRYMQQNLGCDIVWSMEDSFLSGSEIGVGERAELWEAKLSRL